jgi:hypothetical protein
VWSHSVPPPDRWRPKHWRRLETEPVRKRNPDLRQSAARARPHRPYRLGDISRSGQGPPGDRTATLGRRQVHRAARDPLVGNDPGSRRAGAPRTTSTRRGARGRGVSRARSARRARGTPVPCDDQRGWHTIADGVLGRDDWSRAAATSAMATTRRGGGARDGARPRPMASGRARDGGPRRAGRCALAALFPGGRREGRWAADPASVTSHGTVARPSTR